MSMIVRQIGFAIVFVLGMGGFSQSFLAAETNMDTALKSKAKGATNRGLHYLRLSQSENGSWSNSVGITALALRAFLESYRGYNETDGAFITRPIQFILDNVNDDGSISEGIQARSYNTATAITALQLTNNPTYAKVIDNAQAFLKALQIDEAEGYTEEHAYYGGIGYGGDERPDLSNQYYALEAFRITSLDPEDPAWANALIFISRSQNRSESNDQAWAGNDGGFTYMPGYSPHGGTGSYGSMTHAGLLSLLFAGLDKNDPRIQAAYDWIRLNYTLEDNPGAKNKQGLYYYYTAFAKSMYSYGDAIVTDANGIEHNWRDELAEKLLSLQHEDGSWVNEQVRWWEGMQDLVTARCVIALNLVIR